MSLKVEQWIIDFGIATDNDFLRQYNIGRCKYQAEIALLGNELAIGTTKYDYEATPVEVVAGPSLFNTSKGLRVNQRQRLAEFFSMLYPDSPNTSLESSAESEKRSKHRSLSDSVLFRSSKEGNLRISFIRTVRIPQDSLDHKLPPGLGKFPLFSVKDFEGKLPKEITAKGGIFFPMYRKWNSPLRDISSFESS